MTVEQAEIQLRIVVPIEEEEDTDVSTIMYPTYVTIKCEIRYSTR
jgi:hypothetical protein